MYTIDVPSIEGIFSGECIHPLIFICDFILNIGYCLDISRKISNLFVNNIFPLFQLDFGVYLVEIEFHFILLIRWGRYLPLELLIWRICHFLRWRSTYTAVIIISSALDDWSTSLRSFHCCRSALWITVISHHRSCIDFLKFSFYFWFPLSWKDKLLFFEFWLHWNEIGGVHLVTLIFLFILIILP